MSSAPEGPLRAVEVEGLLPVEEEASAGMISTNKGTI